MSTKQTMSEKLKKQLIRHEGLRLYPYQCPAGHTTIGVGRNLDSRGISRSEAMVLLDNDIARARLDVDILLARNHVYRDRLNPARLDALANMAFNLGQTGLGGFRKLFAALAEGDYSLAMDEVLQSRYAEQVGFRAVEIGLQIESGEYQYPNEEGVHEINIRF